MQRWCAALSGADEETCGTVASQAEDGAAATSPAAIWQDDADADDGLLAVSQDGVVQPSYVPGSAQQGENREAWEVVFVHMASSLVQM
jgi:hypothetical protein